MGQTNSAPKVGKHHSLNCQGLSPLFQGSAHSLVADAFDDTEFNQPVGQKLHRPVGSAFWWRATGQRNQMSLLAWSEATGFARPGTIVERCADSTFYEPPAYIGYGVAVQLQLRRNCCVRLAFVCCQQDHRSLQRAGRGLPFTGEAQ
jgi:hypothetical protein